MAYWVKAAGARSASQSRSQRAKVGRKQKLTSAGKNEGVHLREAEVGLKDEAQVVTDGVDAGPLVHH